jgi:hypothetical protein
VAFGRSSFADMNTAFAALVRLAIVEERSWWTSAKAFLIFLYLSFQAWGLGGIVSLKIERLEEIQRDISERRLPQIEDCAALVSEVWRLRTALSGKDLEVSYWRDSHHELKDELQGMAAANQLLTAEIDQLKAVHGLPGCDLETRWSNCAVRLRKQHDMG